MKLNKIKDKITAKEPDLDRWNKMPGAAEDVAQRQTENRQRLLAESRAFSGAVDKVVTEDGLLHNSDAQQVRQEVTGQQPIVPAETNEQPKG